MAGAIHDGVVPIGGFVGLEPSLAASGPWHRNDFTLSTGRAALSLILEAVRPARVHLPEYLCPVLYEPLRSLGVPWTTYPVPELLSKREIPVPAADELLLVIDYFGLQAEAVTALADAYGELLVVDNTQAFFETGHRRCWSFNSARKFFGVPDGAYLYAPRRVDHPTDRAQVGTDHLALRAAGDLDRARPAFLEHERKLGGGAVLAAESSERLLAGFDYRAIAAKRRANFTALHDALGDFNQLVLPELDQAVPHSYPFLCRKTPDRAEFHRRGIFVPTFWPELLSGPDAVSYLAANLLPLPIDQRYGWSEMDLVAQTVHELQVER